MNSSNRVRQGLLITGMAVLILMSGTHAPAAGAAPLSLSDVPLGVASPVGPNIILTFDDSGSMTWGFMPDSVGWNGSYIEANGGDKRAFCSSHYNKLHYDPTTTYTSGVDVNGTVVSTSFAAAWINPYNTGAGTINLSTSYRPVQSMNSAMTSNNSGAYGSPTPTCGESSLPQTAFYFVFDATNAGCDGTDLDDDCYDKVVVGAGEQQNFANWYSFYRTRMLAAKTAAGKAFNTVPSSVRVGYQRLNTCAAALGSTPGSASCPGNYVKPFDTTTKTTFLTWLYGGPSASGTPLRSAAKRAGAYLGRTDQYSPWAENPGSSVGTEHACRANYHILMTDGLWNGDSGFSTGGNVDGVGKSLPSGILADGSTYTPPAYSPGSYPVYEDTNADGVADTAFAAWITDARTDLPNIVTPFISSPYGKALQDLTPAEYFNPDNDPATWQHLATFTIGMGVSGDLDPANYFDRSLPASAGDYDDLLTDAKEWSVFDPNADTGADVDDLWHAAIDGRGRYFSARNPQGAVDAFAQTINNILARLGASAGLGGTSGTVSSATKIYQSYFRSGTWAGGVLAFGIDASKGTINVAPDWDAAMKLNEQAANSPGSGGAIPPREIITYHRTNRDGVPFQWADLDILQQVLLHTMGGVNDGLGSKRVEYLRGDSGNEGSGSGFRTRACFDLKGVSVTCNANKGRLGDVVGSGPIHVGKPPFRYADSMESKKYSDFIALYEDRTPMVYVGANDGMLHAFDAASGYERLAYVPDAVITNLSQLTSPLYSHRYYVDGSPAAADAFFNNNWHTVLVGGLNKGGRGIYALDITDPNDFKESKANQLALWEFVGTSVLDPLDDDRGDDFLGYTYSEPRVAKMPNGKWAVVFGSGYHDSSTILQCTGKTGCGRGYVYIAYLDGGIDGQWTAGDFVRIELKAGSAVGDTTNPNGVPTVALVDLNRDDVTDLIYAGDTKGNMWKIALTASGSSLTSTVSKLFAAVDGSGSPQPITTRPVVGRHPNGGQLVYFGTGKYLELGDNTTSGQTQTFYAIWDDNSGTAPTRSQLLAQTLTSRAGPGGISVRTVSDTSITWMSGGSGSLGWRVDLTDAGERQVSNALLREDRVIFTTLIPSTDPCKPGGTGWLLELDATNGGRVSDTFDLNDDGLFDPNDRVTVSGQTMAVSGVKSNSGAPSAPMILPGGVSPPPGQKCLEHAYSSKSDADRIHMLIKCEASRVRESWQQVK